MIPKKIHYCWFGNKPLDKEAQKCIESWRKYCDGYEIIEWNEENYDLHACKYVEQAATAEKWAFVSDYARFDIIYRFGGLYFDVDVELIKNIDEIIKNGPFMGCEQGKTSFAGTKINSGLGMAGEPGLSIFNEILESYQNDTFQFDANRKKVYTVVERVTNIFKKHGYIENGNNQIVSGVTIYPWDFFCPMNYYNGNIMITNNTCSIHHYNMSWQSSYSKNLKKIERFLRKQFGNTIGAYIYKIITGPVKALHKAMIVIQRH